MSIGSTVLVDVHGLDRSLALAGAQLGPAVTKTIHAGGSLLRTRVRAHASGRPGPRVQTGDYRRGISLQIGVAIGRYGGPAPYATVYSTSPQGQRLENGFIGTDAMGRHYCVDETTEALTQRGWMRHDELRPDDAVLTLNEHTWLSEWQPLLAVNRFAGPHEVTVYEGRTMSSATTDDHRWLTERYYPRRRVWDRRWVTTSTLSAMDRIPLVQKRSDAPPFATISDDVVELAAWFWTEGCYAWSTRNRDGGGRRPTTRPIGLSISQSGRVNPDKHARIVRLLSRLFGDQGRFTDGAHWRAADNHTTGTTVFHLDRVAAWLLERHVHSPDKSLEPAFLCALTADQLDLLIEVSLLADGHVDTSGVTRLGQASEARIRSWEMACALAGRPTVTRHDLPERWTTTLLRTTSSHAVGSAKRKDPEHAKSHRQVVDMVWCPTTPNGTWLARRDGRIYFTGNSQPAFPHWAPASAEVGPIVQRNLNIDVDNLTRRIA